MPTYQYACTACDERLEAVQSFTDAPLTECPACSGALRKVFSAVGVVFKGSGFYKTDSRSAPKAGSKTDGKAAGSDGTSGSTTDAKPAAASDGSAKASSTPAASTTSSTPASKSA